MEAHRNGKQGMLDELKVQWRIDCGDTGQDQIIKPL